MNYPDFLPVDEVHLLLRDNDSGVGSDGDSVEDDVFVASDLIEEDEPDGDGGGGCVAVGEE